jgi:AmpD protein
MSYAIDSTTGLMLAASYKHSPNHNERPEGCSIDLLVIHNISLPPGQYGGNAIFDFFQNKLDKNQHPYFETIAHLQVSSHLFVRRDGTLYQFVPFHQRAWHAGQSSFLGVGNCNDYSIGIELEGQDDEEYTILQYQVLSGVTRSLMQYAPGITLDRIVGHQQIAPDRKTDPGASFNWVYYRSLI